MTSRPFIFAVTAFLAGAGYLVFDRFRDRVTSVPFPARIMAIMIALSIGIGGSFSLAKETLGHGSPAKINHDLAFFRSLYATLPDRRPLVLVGIGEGDLWATTDTGDFIGATFVPYFSDFSPHYLSSRLPPAWEIPTTSAGWKNYDFLVFVPPGREPKVVGMDWLRLKCVTFSCGLLRFCRAR